MEQIKNENNIITKNIIDKEIISEIKNDINIPEDDFNKDIHTLKKEYKILISQNSKIKYILKKMFKHIKYLDKEIIVFKKFSIKNTLICNNINLLLSNFKETLLNLKKERDSLEQKQLDNKILIDKLKDKIKTN